jgi:hypothetical protein
MIDGVVRALDDLDLVAFHDRHARIGRAEVDTDDFAHFCNLLTLIAAGPAFEARLFQPVRAVGRPKFIPVRNISAFASFSRP